MELAGKRIVVTGGARGIGEELVAAFVHEGAAVVSLDVLADAGRQIAAAANKAGPGTAEFLVCDVASRAEVNAAIDEAVRLLGGLDALVHVAGITHQIDTEDLTEEQWDRVFDVNVKGTLFTNQAAVRHLKASGGRILDFASGAGLIGYPRQSHYAASKGAVVAFVRSVAREWGKYGITVNAICPAMWTPMYEEARARRSPEELAAHDEERKASMCIDGRMGDTQRDLAPFMVFMVGAGSRFISGQTLVVDGGRTFTR
ncbi:SDR family NAD(P)-dependent oxidoreductase [Frankia gtarii]|uniref:SDR family NAD(P)-dependent oxidoreductase n=1 Tax=Frankia gtarii TaxID=2950102 RepID=UPI0021BE6CB6|nr:SDR family NAD(P)-dependent oxidoreductase [Frankia gtarii]